MRQRLSAQARRKEILEAGFKLFETRGFLSTTMEDVVSATTLSKGGLYHYYQNTTDILYDLLNEGLLYRIERIKTRQREPMTPELGAQLLVEKILDENRYMGVYVEFLLVKHHDPKLEALWTLLKASFREAFLGIFPHHPLFEDEESFEFLTDVINGFLISAQALGSKARFKAFKPVLESMFKTLEIQATKRIALLES